MSSARAFDLTTEYRNPAPWVPVATPRLSWKSQTAEPNWLQAAAQLEWTCGAEVTVHLVNGGDSVLVDWPFAPLLPRQSGSLRVRVRGEGEDSWGPWSPPRQIRSAQLGEGEWVAEFVQGGQRDGHPVLLRTAFTVHTGLRSAVLYATATGVYQAEINGTEVDDQVLKPGWTPYRRRLIHETTDVTAMLTDGENVLGAELAGGWYTENYGFLGFAKPFYGTVPSFAALLVLEYDDGRIDTVSTGTHWTTSADGPITASGIYPGEHYDARRRIDGWSQPGFDDRSWMTAVRDESAHPLPRPRNSPTARRIDELSVTEVITSPSGRTLLDFGQNLVGRLRITVDGPAGSTVTLRHAEVLEDGELGTRPLRYADATDSYTLAGEGPETWEPAFTFHGFRYAEITGWPGELDPTAVTAIVLHSDMTRTGWFKSSNPLLDRLHENVVWGMKGNFLYLPTDCPQRDERLGWTGDIQVFAPTASYLFDADGFLASWLEDLALEQAPDGRVPFVVPDVLGSVERPAAAWGDAATIVPWTLYQRFGDRAVLERQYLSMRGWVDHVSAIAGERHLWEGRFQFGDWLDPDAPADRPGDAKTDNDIVASAYLFRSTALVARTAALLGRTHDANHYTETAEAVRTAWLNEYVTPGGRIMSDAPTAYALAIVFDLATEPALRRSLGARLAWLVRRDGYRIHTGFVGTPLVQDALVSTGHTATAARLTLQTENPSWLYPVTMGATTIWERWDSMLEDGSINPGEMTSFNHYALGAIADWLHRRVGGLAPASPGYRHIAIAPAALPGLEHAATALETPYGRASVRWERGADGLVTVNAVVPANTTAHVELEDGYRATVGAGEHQWSYTQPAPAPRQPLTLDSPLSEIIDDPHAHRVVVDTVAELDPERAELLRRYTKWTRERALRGEFEFVEPAVLDAVADALAALGRERTHV